MQLVHLRLVVASFVFSLCACRGGAPPVRDPTGSVARDDAKSEVLVLGMIHDGHHESETYGLEVVERIVRAVDPDYVLAESLRIGLPPRL